LTHVPIYAVHRDGVADKARDNWAHLFERYGVSLVFVGHQHVYSRSYPMRGGKIDNEDGIVYVMGNAGQKYYGSADERFSERTVYNVTTYQLVRIDGGSLTVQAFDIDGNELDYFQISPRVPERPYPDVPTTEWFYAAVDYVRARGLIDPIGGSFAPNAPMTRAMLVEALFRVESGELIVESYGDVGNSAPNSPLSTLHSQLFSDVADDAWYHDAVVWAAGNGIVNGVGDSRFNPDGLLTREQVATILYRYSKRSADGATLNSQLSTLNFTDASSISGWALEAVVWASGMKIINGMGDGRIAPKGTMTRAQAAQILLNMS